MGLVLCLSCQRGLYVELRSHDAPSVHRRNLAGLGKGAGMTLREAILPVMTAAVCWIMIWALCVKDRKR